MNLNKLLEQLPNHLHLARNSNAEDYDRWRLYTTVTKKYIEESGAPTAYECLMKYIIDKEKTEAG